MKIEIQMIDTITITHDVSGITLEEFVNVIGKSKHSNGLVALKTKNDTDIIINPNKIICMKEVK